MTTAEKISIVSGIIPPSYQVTEDSDKGVNNGHIRCRSLVGMGDLVWGVFFNAIKAVFPDFDEVYHLICHEHRDFIIYFKPTHPSQQ
jgi:hypothetical protein